MHRCRRPTPSHRLPRLLQQNASRIAEPVVVAVATKTATVENADLVLFEFAKVDGVSILLLVEDAIDLSTVKVGNVAVKISVVVLVGDLTRIHQIGGEIVDQLDAKSVASLNPNLVVLTGNDVVVLHVLLIVIGHNGLCLGYVVS